MYQRGGQTRNWGAQISNGWAGHRWPPAGDGPGQPYLMIYNRGNGTRVSSIRGMFNFDESILSILTNSNFVEVTIAHRLE